MTFGQRLRQIREEKGLTRESLASISGVPFGTIHGYEIGRRAPALSASLRLAKALGVDCTAFAECDDMQGEPTEEEPEPKKPAAKKRGKK